MHHPFVVRHHPLVFVSGEPFVPLQYIPLNISLADLRLDPSQIPRLRLFVVVVFFAPLPVHNLLPPHFRVHLLLDRGSLKMLRMK